MQACWGHPPQPYIIAGLSQPEAGGQPRQVVHRGHGGCYGQATTLTHMEENIHYIIV